MGESRDSERPVMTHLEELRGRLLWAAIGVLLTTGLAFAFYKRIFQFLMGPAEQFAAVPGGKPVFTQLTEMIGITMKVSLYTGVALALPLVLYQIVRFVAPGLTARERRYLYSLAPGALLAFAAGAAFGYYVLVPPAVRFLLTFGSDIATPMIRVGNYLSLVVSLLFWIGLAFETPIVMFMLGRTGVASGRRFASWRRYAILVAFVLSAVITPTFDPINQTLVALPIVALYEAGIWLTRLAERARRQESRRARVAEEGGS